MNILHASDPVKCVDKDGNAVKFLARDDSDADLYRNKVGATA